MDTKHEALITRLHDEADLCRNDGVPETAKLLDDAIARIEELERALEMAQDAMTLSLNPGGSWPMQVKQATIDALKTARALLTKKD